jgi:hypothetical protein
MANAQVATGSFVVCNGYVVAETTENTQPKFTRAKDDGTGYGSTNKVHLAGIGEWGDGSFTCFAIDDAAQDYLVTLRDAGTSVWWKFVRPATWKSAGTVTPFRTDKTYGWVSGWEYIGQKEGRATYKLTITPEETVTTGITTLGAALTSTFLAFTNQADEAITAISPAAAATTYKYALTAFSDDTGVKITPTATTGTIYVNGVAVVSGAPSAAITIGTGTKTVYVMVVESDLKCSPIYQIDITRGTVASPT